MHRPRATVALPALAFALAACAGAEALGRPPQDLPPLHRKGRPYRTPRAGEGFRTTVFGEEVRVPPRDRRSVSAWDLGLAATAPGPAGSEALPFGAIYLWRRPDRDVLFRAVLAGFYDEVLYARSPRGWGGFEVVGTFENLSPPAAQGEVVDGRVLDEEELLWGYARGGVGLGYREQIGPHQDNMRSLALTLEPGYLWFDEGGDAAADFVAPQDTFELRAHLQGKWDAMERNLFELAHTGFAFGADLVAGYRTDQEAWGRGAAVPAREGRAFHYVTAYGFGAMGVPGIASERHRLLGQVWAGAGAGLDRFSAPRVGGGPTGDEYGALARPILPGAVVREFFPDHYVVALAEYRYELAFFTYLSARAAVGWLERPRGRGGALREEDDVLAAVGVRVTTGFFFETLLQIDYAYNEGVIRGGDRGGHEVVVHLSGSF